MIATPRNKLLIVDDDPIILTTLKHILKREYTVVCAEDARQG